MILLLGGTSETAPIIEALLAAGETVLLCTATDIPLDLPVDPRIRRRTGPLDPHSLAELMEQHAIDIVVDATHPYANTITALAQRVAQQRGVAYWAYVRPSALDDTAEPRVHWAHDHERAAELSCRLGSTLLLTIGSTHLRPYASHARKTGRSLVVRVLDHPRSLQACREAGIDPSRIIAGRGPYSAADTRAQIATHGVDVLVTKDSGAAGGVHEKLQAAAEAHCHVVAVRRPDPPTQACASIDQLMRALAHTERCHGG